MLFILIGFFLFLSHDIPIAYAQEISLSPAEEQGIGEKVFRNECSDEDKCLVSWNEGEDFLSLGIGHFIWYPAGKKGPFEESFAEFLVYLEEKNKQLPAWLTEGPESHCPWKDRLDFMRDSGSVRALDLRKFLLETKTEQIAFLIKRLQEALPTMVKNVPEADREQITRQFYRMARTPAGVYALVDYINFKGLGVVPTERYRGQGWGLAQVLGGMTGEEDGVAALEEFVRTAEGLLTERVNNAPVERNEVRWLPGWKNRVNSYLDVQETKTPRG